VFACGASSASAKLAQRCKTLTCLTMLPYSGFPRFLRTCPPGLCVPGAQLHGPEPRHQPHVCCCGYTQTRMEPIGRCALRLQPNANDRSSAAQSAVYRSVGRTLHVEQVFGSARQNVVACAIAMKPCRPLSPSWTASECNQFAGGASRSATAASSPPTGH
jgi:hypothetical protein